MHRRGDGVSVSLIECSNKITKSYFDLGTDGKGSKYLVMPYGAFRNPSPEILDEPVIWKENLKEKQSYMNGFEFLISPQEKNLKLLNNF